jgi:hypothetical protein
MISLPEEADGVVAVGWATVDLDRAARELAHLLPDGARFGDAAPSVILGARCRSARAADAGPWIALLEPDTEGRLAGTLARSGEGWAATWMLADATAPWGSRAMSVARPGPFGAERLVVGGPLPAHHRLVVEAVPSPP